MRPGEDELVRWRDGRGSMDPSALPSRAADLVDAAREVPALAPETLARVKVDVLARRPSRARGLPPGLRFALLTSVVLASVATAKGTMLLWRRYVATPTHVDAPERRRGPQAPKNLQARVEMAPVIEPMEPTPPAEPTPAEVPVASAPHPRRAVTTGAAARRAPDAADATTEAQLLAGALSRLRGTHDPRAALALLDQYARSYPRGVLASEALSARLEAVLALDDRQAALKLLDGRATFAGRLGAEQLLTRAELRASAGRYADALSDFDRLLGPAAAPAADLERALYGRAVSLGHLGRDARARADLVAYQQRFPAGKHAAEVARLLKGGGVEKRP